MRPLISIAIVAIIYPAAAHALSPHGSTCDAQIARAEIQLRKPHPNIWLPESTFAKLNYQPTRQDVQQAEADAKNALKAALVRARKLNSQGKNSQCVAAIDRFLLP
jgi:hypothetical protein